MNGSTVARLAALERWRDARTKQRCEACRDWCPVGLFISEQEYDEWLAGPEAAAHCPVCGQARPPFQAIVFSEPLDHPPEPGSLAAALRPDLRL